MTLATAYMASVKNVGPILDAIKDAGVPPKFTHEFLKSLGFSSSNDRAIISVLRGLGFLDVQGVPSDTYRRFRDRTQAKRVLAEAMRDAYGDLFLAHQRANELSAEKLKGFFASKTDKGDRVVDALTSTFRAFAQQADFTQPSGNGTAPKVIEAPANGDTNSEESLGSRKPRFESEFHYNIQIHLPATRDVAIYNAIFKALRENLS